MYNKGEKITTDNWYMHSRREETLKKMGAIFVQKQQNKKNILQVLSIFCNYNPWLSDINLHFVEGA